MIMTYHTNKTSFFSIRWWKNLWEKISSFKFFPSNSPSKRTRSEGDVDLMPISKSFWVDKNKTIRSYKNSVPLSEEQFLDSLSACRGGKATRFRMIPKVETNKITPAELQRRKAYQPKTYMPRELDEVGNRKHCKKNSWSCFFSMFRKANDAETTKESANNRIEVQRTCDGTYIL